MAKEYNRRGVDSTVVHPAVSYRDALREALGEPEPSPFVAVGLIFVAPGADKL